jgi:hypothetical protein
MVLNQIPVTIAANGTNSSQIALNGALPCGVFIDPQMTSTTMTFAASPNAGASAYPISDGNSGTYTESFTAGQYVPLNPSTFAGVPFLTIVAGSTESALRNLIIIALAN